MERQKYQKSADLEKLGQYVIEHYPKVRHLSDCKIGYLYCDKEKKTKYKTTFADTGKVSVKMQELTGLDFVVTFYEPSCSNFDDNQMEILMYHELLHVGFNPEDGSRWLIPHDVEDFREIVEKCGLDWQN